MVLTGGLFYSSIPVTRGSRQGCVLSPLQLLAQRIRQHTLISSIIFRNTIHHLSLFADDILLYIEKAQSLYFMPFTPFISSVRPPPLRGIEL